MFSFGIQTKGSDDFEDLLKPDINEWCPKKILYRHMPFYFLIPMIKGYTITILIFHDQTILHSYVAQMLKKRRRDHKVAS